MKVCALHRKCILIAGQKPSGYYGWWTQIILVPCQSDARGRISVSVWVPRRVVFCKSLCASPRATQPK